MTMTTTIETYLIQSSQKYWDGPFRIWQLSNLFYWSDTSSCNRFDRKLCKHGLRVVESKLSNKHATNKDERQRKAERNKRETLYTLTGSWYRQSSLRIFRIKHNFFNDVYDSVLHTHVWSHHSYSLCTDEHVELYSHISTRTRYFICRRFSSTAASQSNPKNVAYM